MAVAKKRKAVGIPPVEPPNDPKEKSSEREGDRTSDFLRLPTDKAIYADQLGDVIFGFHTSRLVFATERGQGALEPVVEVVIPTEMLLNAALNVVSALSDPRMVDETVRRYSEQLRLMKSLRKP